jgi:hypothetical protein
LNTVLFPGVISPITVGRPGSELKQTRAARACCSMIGRENGEPISSSPVNSATTGAGAPPNFLIAAMTKQFMTRPAFMSATPGP